MEYGRSSEAAKFKNESPPTLDSIGRRIARWHLTVPVVRDHKPPQPHPLGIPRYCSICNNNHLYFHICPILALRPGRLYWMTGPPFRRPRPLVMCYYYMCSVIMFPAVSLCIKASDGGAAAVEGALNFGEATPPFHPPCGPSIISPQRLRTRMRPSKKVS